MILFDYHDAMRLCNRIENRLLIQRFDRTKIDNFRGDVLLFELCRDFERERNCLRVTNNRDVAAFAFHVGFAKRNEQFFIRRLDHSLRAVEQLGFQNQHRIVVAHGCFEQPFCVARRGRGANFEAGHAGVKVFRRVRMRGAKLVRRSVRAAKRDGNIELAA